MAGAGGFLTTHVLDTAQGVPAAGVELELFSIEDGSREKLASAVTNADGRTDHPILPSDQFSIGHYELVFHCGSYLRRLQAPLNEPLFLDEVPIRFGINDATAHYHVPLLLSPFGYSTYRGS